ncbi:MAG: hypothetical protein HXS52_11615 [Theionarchaea archaeon]|nr:hypothetical protein [Theionarchaea archaeon]MBU7038569.1 hypothetical protein [Theionarchaea archaeon]
MISVLVGQNLIKNEHFTPSCTMFSAERESNSRPSKLWVDIIVPLYKRAGNHVLKQNVLGGGVYHEKEAQEL